MLCLNKKLCTNGKESKVPKRREGASVKYNVMKRYVRKREEEKDKIIDIYLKPYQVKIYKLQQL